MTNYADQHLTSRGEVDGRLTIGFRMLTMAEFAPRMVSDSGVDVVPDFQTGEDGRGEDGYVVDDVFLPIRDVEFPERPNLTSNPEFWYSKKAKVKVHHVSYKSVAAQVRKYIETPLEELERQVKEL